MRHSANSRNDRDFCTKTDIHEMNIKMYFLSRRITVVACIPWRKFKIMMIESCLIFVTDMPMVGWYVPCTYSAYLYNILYTYSLFIFCFCSTIKKYISFFMYFIKIISHSESVKLFTIEQRKNFS